MDGSARPSLDELSKSDREPVLPPMPAPKKLLQKRRTAKVLGETYSSNVPSIGVDAIAEEDSAAVGDEDDVPQAPQLARQHTEPTSSKRSPSPVPKKAQTRELSREPEHRKGRATIGGFLPKVKMGAFSIVDEHPLFKGVSEDFKAELAPHIIRRHLGEKTSDKIGPDIRGIDRQGVFGVSDFEYRDTSRVRTLIAQGEPPPNDLDGLILSDSRFNADIELVYDGYVVATLQGNAALGCEVAFGLTKNPIFATRVRREPSYPVFIIPRWALQAALNKEDEYDEDKTLLRERVVQMSAEVLHNWCSQYCARMKILLFSNASMKFKSRLIQSMTVSLFGAGSTISTKGDASDSCIFIYQGQAQVVDADTRKVTQLSQSGSHATAWSAWWGFLEASGVCSRRLVSVVAETDCIVWQLDAEQLKELRNEFPSECSFFDKVAVKHVKMMAGFALDVWQVPILKECEPEFLQHLTSACEQRIFLPGDTVMTEGDYGTEMFVLVRGRVSVTRAGALLSRLGEGNCFGELAVLGITSTRTATIRCDTICDLRVLARSALLEALSHFPRESARLERIAEAHGYSRKLAVKELQNQSCFEGFSQSFVKSLTEHMHEQAFFLGQTLIKQDDDQFDMYFLVNGTVAMHVSGTEACQVVGPAVIGEMALLSPGSRAQATIRCVTVCECLGMHTPHVSAALRKDFPAEFVKLEEMAKLKEDEMREGLMTSVFVTGAVAGDGDGPSTEQDTEDSEKRKLEVAGAGNPFLNLTGSFFAESPIDFLEQLSLHLEKRIYFDGQAMLREGEEGDYALLIHDGNGVVEVGGVRVAEIKKGDFVGEVVLLGCSDFYTATIKASGLVTAFAIEKHKLREVIESFPDEQARLEEIMKRRVKLTRNLTKIKAFCNFLPDKKAAGKRGSQDFGDIDEHFCQGRTSHITASSSRRQSRMTRLSISGRRESFFGRSSRNHSVSSQCGVGSQIDSRTSTNTHRGLLTSRRTSFLETLKGVAEQQRSRTPSSRGSTPLDASVNENEDETEEQLPEPKKPKDICGRIQSRRWVRKRKEAIRAAPWYRDLNLQRKGKVAEALPPTQGYRAAKAGAGTPFATISGDGQKLWMPSSMRLQKATSVYGRPVWHEVFGAPVTLPPLTR